MAKDIIALNVTSATCMSQVKSDPSLAVVLNHTCTVPGHHLVL